MGIISGFYWFVSIYILKVWGERSAFTGMLIICHKDNPNCGILQAKWKEKTDIISITFRTMFYNILSLSCGALYSDVSYVREWHFKNLMRVERVIADGKPAVDF